MSRPGTPKLQKTEYSLSMRTRKSHQDFRMLAAESLARKGGDDRVFAHDQSFQENDGLLSQVIEMGINDDEWYNNSKSKDTQKWYKLVSLVQRNT